MNLWRILVLTTSLALTGPVWAAPASAAGRDAMLHFFHPTFGDLKEELTLARKEGKLGLFMMFSAEACGPCIVMKKTVLSRVEVQEHFRRHFRVLHIDYNGDDEMADLKGRQLRSKDYAQNVARVRGTPSFMAIGLDGAELLRHYGPTRDAREFMGFAHYVVVGEFRRRPFDAFWRDWRAAAP